MVRKQYTLIQGLNAAPTLDVIIIHEGSKESQSVPMIIDTGASISSVPLSVLKDLKAQKVKEDSFLDFNQQTLIRPIFVVTLQIHKMKHQRIEIIGTDNQYYGLLGRDVLKYYILNCHGPKQIFNLDYCP